MSVHVKCEGNPVEFIHFIGYRLPFDIQTVGNEMIVLVENSVYGSGMN